MLEELNLELKDANGDLEAREERKKALEAKLAKQEDKADKSAT